MLLSSIKNTDYKYPYDSDLTVLLLYYFVARRTIQRHETPSFNFYRDWSEYEAGFGDVENDFWIGLSELHRLTSECSVSLHIHMEARPGDVGPPHGDTGAVHGPTGYANYDSFAVGDAASNYVLSISGD